MKRLIAGVLVAVAALAGAVLAGPPIPGKAPKVDIAEALRLVDAHLKAQDVDAHAEQFIVSAVLMHRDNSNDKTPKAMGFYWDIKWKLKLPGRGDKAKLKKILRHEVDMAGKVYDRS